MALISFLNPPPDKYFSIHVALLEACKNSKLCKRFIPSEWAGNIKDFPHLPRFYGASRAPFREVLAKQNEVEWTLVNQGWLMDYFLKASQTYMPAIPDEFPIDPNQGKACIRGTGEEPQSWTCARDVARAVAALLQSDVPWVSPSIRAYKSAFADSITCRTKRRTFAATGGLSTKLCRHFRILLKRASM